MSDDQKKTRILGKSSDSVVNTIMSSPEDHAPHLPHRGGAPHPPHRKGRPAHPADFKLRLACGIARSFALLRTPLRPGIEAIPTEQPGEVLQRIITEVGTQLALCKSRVAQPCFPPLDRAGWMARYGTAPVADDPGNFEEQDPWGGDADAHWEPTGGNLTAPWDGLDPSPGRRS